MVMTYDALARAGAKLAFEQGLSKTDPADCVWALTVDAARTFKSMPDRHGPRGYPSQSPLSDVHHTHWERFSTELERLKDNVQVTTDLRPQPAPDAHTRAYAMWELWFTTDRLRRVMRDPDIKIRALWLYAVGAPPALIKRSLGVPKPSLYRNKQRCCEVIAELVYSEKMAA